MATDKIGQHFIVQGRVQGVFYRKFAQQQAKALQLCGWVRNLPDGCVEIQAFGSKQQLSQYLEILKKGPPAAHVIDVKIMDIAFETTPDFEILKTNYKI
jgi:acylphosphatase